MKRMRDFQNILDGVKCEKTKRAFNKLIEKGKKPRVVNGGVAYRIRLHVKGFYYDYIPQTNKVARVEYGNQERAWVSTKGVVDMLRVCERMSTKGWPATDKQISLVEKLAQENNYKFNRSVFNDRFETSNLIDKLMELGKENDEYEKVFGHEPICC